MSNRSSLNLHPIWISLSKKIHGKFGDPLSWSIDHLYKMPNVIYLSLSEKVQAKAENAFDVLVNETHV